MGELVNENKVEIYMRGGAVCAAEEEIRRNTYRVIILVVRRLPEKEEKRRNTYRESTMSCEVRTHGFEARIVFAGYIPTVSNIFEYVFY